MEKKPHLMAIVLFLTGLICIGLLLGLFLGLTAFWNGAALIGGLLTSGDDSVDLITVNDEMISEFKHKGFLLPLEDTVMTEETAANFPQEYLKEICMSDGHIFSVPFRIY